MKNMPDRVNERAARLFKRTALRKSRLGEDYIAFEAFIAALSATFAAFMALSEAFIAFSTTFSTTAFEAFAVSLAGFSPQAARAIRLAEAKTTAIFFIVYGSHSIMPRLARP